ncbi:helix-turn-helix transcriptional regulator [Vibrio renipiscarius]|uniref:LuxR family transcriptional regulator n=1 Tax=Vibrio renipiscarius TaxID=1461322 RepID=A0A0C2K858_9VIBR|nr:helix-turn-helix transcriptional regulator [Vibrio renipiscarius]KII76280.1 LuxR family transcriptional regulator [Vibrio renipiscarius]KII78198.1 LuxR family transcriptional regulator [Vibrio renipiscarius]
MTSVNRKNDSLINQLPGYWGCKDLNSVFVDVNQAYAQLIGFQTAEQVIGLTDHDMPSPTTVCADDFRLQDQHVINTQRSLKILDIHPYADGCWRAHIFTKKPWFDDHGNVQGTIFFGQDLTETAILEVGHWICRATGLSGNLKLPKIDQLHGIKEKLTAREEEVLFLLLYGKKPTYIAAAMNISIKTFEGYVARLRSKFCAHSKAQLIDIALERGYGSHIPQTLLRIQLSVVLNNENAA